MKANTRNRITFLAIVLVVVSLVAGYYLFPSYQHLILIAGLVLLGVVHATTQQWPAV